MANLAIGGDLASSYSHELVGSSKLTDTWCLRLSNQTGLGGTRVRTMVDAGGIEPPTCRL